MSYLRYLCLFAYSGVTHILGFFVLCFFVFVYPVLPFSLDCPFLLAPSVFSNVYFDCTLTRIHQFTTVARNFQVKLVSISIISFHAKLYGNKYYLVALKLTQKNETNTM